MVQVAKIPTFQVIILQGILGSTPWNALVYLTLYLQLIGFRDSQAALAVACFQAGAALGGVVGGVVGDWAAKRSHNHGRIFACQFSVSMGIPFSLLLMKGLPQNGEPLTVAMYVVTLFTFGLLHVWAAPACNNPVFAEIVPAELRNLVYAFDRYETPVRPPQAPLCSVCVMRKRSRAFVMTWLRSACTLLLTRLATGSFVLVASVYDQRIHLCRARCAGLLASWTQLLGGGAGLLRVLSQLSAHH